MASVNKVIIIGHLGKDPETRFAPSGDAICNFTVATSESWKDKATGEKKEKTEWHRITCYGKLAEIVGLYLRKGSKVYVEGKLQTRKWEDKDGIVRYTTEIIASEMRMLSSKQEGDDEAEPRPAREQHQGAKAAPKPAPAGNYGTSGGFGDMDDDIPFD